MMNTVDLILESSVKFYDTLKKDENGRYRSWEHCYSNFINARDNKNAELDYLSLQLAFYLARMAINSEGRGSRFKGYFVMDLSASLFVSHTRSTATQALCFTLKMQV